MRTEKEKHTLCGGLSYGWWWFLCVYGVGVSASQAESDEGPFGLQWGMSKEEVEKLNIRLCCEQLGKWGLRYQVHSKDFQYFSKRLGDEEKIYVYFGNKNKLLRMYVATSRVGGENRYNQLKELLASKYNMIKQCDAKAKESCNDYRAYAAFAKDAVDVFIGFEENVTYRDKIFITLLHKQLFEADKGSKNPF